MLKITDTRFSFGYSNQNLETQKETNIIYDLNFIGTKSVGIVEDFLGKFKEVKRDTTYYLNEDGFFYFSKKEKGREVMKITKVNIKDVIKFLGIKY